MENAVNWEEVMATYPMESLVSGTVVHHAHFGVFIDFGHPVIKGLIERTEFSDESNRDIAQESLFPGIGKQVTGVVVGYSKHNNELRISMRPSMMQKFKEGHS